MCTVCCIWLIYIIKLGSSDIFKIRKKKSSNINRLTVPLGGIFELHFKHAKKQDLKPIIGIEGYYVDDYDSEELKDLAWNYAHIMHLLKNRRRLDKS